MKKLIALLLLLASPALAANTTIQTNYCQITPTVSTSIYAAKDVLSPIMVCEKITCPNSLKGKITSIQLFDDSDNAVEYDVVLFRSAPATSFVANAAFDPSDADLLLMQPVINLATTDHFSFTTNGVSSLSSLTSNAISAAKGTATIPGGDSLPTGGSLWIAVVQRGTPTYAAADDVTFRLGWECNAN